MKIMLNVEPFKKPLEQPQTIIPKKKVSGNPFQPPMVRANTLPAPVIKPVTITYKEKKPLVSFKLRLANPVQKVFKVNPVPSTKNDKVHLLIESFGNSYREMVNQVNKINLDEEGLHLPEQDKFFFETVIQRDSFTNYVTTNEEQEDFVKQQVEFCWFRSPIKDIEEDIYDKIDESKAIGYDFSLKYTSGLSLKMDGRLQERPLRDFLELSKLLKDDEKVFIQFGFNAAENDWFKDAERTAKELPKRIKKGQNSLDKIEFNGYECSLRLIVQGASKIRSEVVARGFITALRQLNGDNELIDKKIKEKKFGSWLKNKVRARKIPSHFMFKKRFILTHKEMNNFIKLPQRTLQTEYDLRINEREETNIHTSLRGKGLLIGYSEEKNRKIPIKIPYNNLDDFAKSYLFLGSPRTGKDTSMINFIVEAAKIGCGAIIPDVINEQGNDRGMADSVRDALSPDKIIDLNLGDFNNPIYFGMDDIIDIVGVNGVNLVANNLVKVLQLDDLSTSKQLSRLLFKVVKCNLYDAYCFLQSDKYAKQVYKELLTTDELLALELKYRYFDQGQKISQAKNAILARLDDLLGNDVIKNMFAQEPNDKMNLREWIKEGKVVIIRATKNDLGELGAQVMMYLLTLKVFWLKKMMHHECPNQVTFLVFNEFFQYMSKGLESTISDAVVECPKYRLSFLFAFHNTSSAQISRSLWEVLQSASLNFFLFKNTNFGVYRDMAEQLDPIPLEIAMKTEKYESIFLPYIGGKQLTPIFVKMLPPPKQRMKMYDNSNISEIHACQYGTSIHIVKERIKDRELEMYKEEEEEKKEK
jgi:hypothetical protein